MTRSLVLVVEDSQLLSALLCDALRAHGVGDEVVACRDAASARVRLETALRSDVSLDLAVVDIEMPGEDGLSFGRAMRVLEAGAGARPAPIVFYSSRAPDDAIAAAVLDCFPARFVQKADEGGPALVALEGARLMKRMLGGPGT